MRRSMVKVVRISVSCKNSSSYFDSKMIEEEEMEKQVNDGAFDECAYVKNDDDLCA